MDKLYDVTAIGELIKYLMEGITGKVGFIRPTFEEYFNRYHEKDSVVYVPQDENFSYDVEDLMEYFDGTGIGTMILINPDNPSGNYIKRENMLRLVKWCGEREIRIIIDESFIDFSEEMGTLIQEEIVDQYPNLVLMKSISKSYGIPGVRLGILVSSDKELVAGMKKEAAIWNINSFGEFYMQIAEKYKKDYLDALGKLKQERENLRRKLSAIPGLRAIPSQANYILAEITCGMTAKELTKVLLLKYNLFIKDLSGKIQLDGKQFVRLAVRNARENDRLIEALSEALGM